MPLIIPPSQTLVAGGQTIAPSSNDWDYSFDGGGEWLASGNALGDHTSGGFVDGAGGDSALPSLITFDGNCKAYWTNTGTRFCAGFHEIAEDSKRATAQRNGMKASSTESWLIDATHLNDGDPMQVMYGDAEQDTHTFADGSVILFERVGGVISIYDDDALVHAFSQTSNNPIRFWFSAGGSPFTRDCDNLFFEDTDQVQRDGYFNETSTSGKSIGANNAARVHYGFSWNATRSGTIQTAKINIDSHNTTFNCQATLWLSDGTNPTGSAIATSDTISMDGTGNKTFTFSSDAIIKKGVIYWFVL